MVNKEKKARDLKLSYPPASKTICRADRMSGITVHENNNSTKNKK